MKALIGGYLNCGLESCNSIRGCHATFLWKSITFYRRGCVTAPDRATYLTFKIWVATYCRNFFSKNQWKYLNYLYWDSPCIQLYKVSWHISTTGGRQKKTIHYRLLYCYNSFLLFYLDTYSIVRTFTAAKCKQNTTSCTVESWRLE